MDQVLDLPRQMTRVYLASQESLQTTDTSMEDAIRANLEMYKDKRLLRLKFEKQLEEHLKTTGSNRQRLDERTQAAIIERIKRG